MEVNFLGGGRTYITVDSGAEENVCPYGWGENFGLRNPEEWLEFRGAGTEILEHYGSRTVRVVAPF